MNTYRLHQSTGLLRAGLLSLALAFASLWGTSRALAQATANPPEKMTYHRYLVDATGAALGLSAPKNYDVIFRIWDSQSGGSKLWTEQQTVTVDKGYFSVLLGEGSSIGEARPGLSTIFTNATASDRWVGITVKGIGAGSPPADVDILPRLRLLSSPYAFLASKAIIVDGAGVTTGTISDARLSGNVALRAGGNTFTGNQVVNGGNIGLGVAVPTAALHIAGGIKINTNNILEFGAGNAGKEGNGGKLGYQAFSTDALDIVGAGTDGTNRKLKVWAEGGTTLSGPLTTSASVTAGSFTGDGTIPVGGIILWSGAIANIPSGWALCNGQTANGQVTPNLTDRFIVGAGSGYAVANTGGAASVALTEAQMPSHSHSYKDGYFIEAAINSNYYGIDDTGLTNLRGSGSSDSDNRYIYYRNMTTAATGGSQAHENRPPYYALAYIMRVR